MNKNRMESTFPGLFLIGNGAEENKLHVGKWYMCFVGLQAEIANEYEAELWNMVMLW